MGLFGGKKVYVSSVVYNMAGPVEERINFLKTVVGSSVISNTGFSMADVITGNYLNGPGIQTRSFYRWAKRAGNYDGIGVPSVNIYSPGYDIGVIGSNIPRAAGEGVQVQDIKYGPAEYSYWAEQHVMEHFQTLFDTAWTADYNPVTNQITITWADSSTTSFTPSIAFGSNYYYITYGLNDGTNYIGARMWIYEVGSGNAAMDAMPVENPLIGDFLPFIPVRLKNQFLSSTYQPEAYALAKKAYKKATKKKFDDLVDMIADNADLGDIDHTYMVWGVSLNAPDRAARRYLFRFFEFLMTAQLSGSAEYTTYQTDYNSYEIQAGNFETARQVYDESGGTMGGPSDPVMTSPPPPPPGEPINQIQIKSPGSLETKLNMVMRWNKIEKTSGSGMKSGATKKGDVWWDDTIFMDGNGSVITFINNILSAVEGSDRVTLNWQMEDDYWESITITGLSHENLIYDGKSVKIRAGNALADADESGFLVPIHYETLRSMSLIDSTQMMTCGTYLVFNCYEVVKQKWYQTGIFKIFIFVVMIVLTVATMGATAPGLLGAAGAVGATLGFTGLMATIVGAIANALAAMILMQFISIASVEIFGAKLGAIIATVASAIAMSFGSSLMSGMSMAQAWGNMMNVVNIMQLTSAVGNGVAGYMQASIAGIQADTAKLQAEYEKNSEEIQKLWLQNFGQGDFHFDPNMLTNNYMGGVAELPQSFLDRTLLTGSDIAEMTNGMLSDFTSLTLDMSTIRS